MYKIVIIIIFIATISCTKTEYVYLVPNSGKKINSEISITNYQNETDSLIIKGNITTKENINNFWYVLADFYTDSTFTHKLGFGKTLFNYSLKNNEKTTFKIVFKNNNVELKKFPNFKVKNLETVYK